MKERTMEQINLQQTILRNLLTNDEYARKVAAFRPVSDGQRLHLKVCQRVGGDANVGAAAGGHVVGGHLCAQNRPTNRATSAADCS